MKRLHKFEHCVNQARPSVKKSESDNIHVKKTNEGRSGQTEQYAFQPATSLSLVAEQGWREFVVRAAEPDFGLPVGVFVVLLDITVEGIPVFVAYG